MTLLWNRADLLAATSGHFAAASGTDIAGTGVSIDTRTLHPGDIFIALRGENSNGHDHVARALEAGAACVVAHEDCGTDPRILRVDDTLAAMQAMARYARARFGGRMLAVTGSVGKTSVKDMLHAALAACGPTHCAVASYNNHWGVPLTLARLPAGAAYCVCEIGMNHAGEIAPLAAMVRPDVAVVTTVASSHLGLMGSVEAIAREKAEILLALHRGGIGIIPDGVSGQAFFERNAAQAGATVWRAGTGEGCAIVPGPVRATATGSDFSLRLPGWVGEAHVSAPGRHMAANAMLALGAACAAGADMARAVAGLATFRPGAGRGAMTKVMQDKVALLDESYNASPASVQAALDLLGLVAPGRRVAVLGDMLELGAFAGHEHVSLLPAVRANADIVFCCGPNMKTLFDTLPPSLRGAWTPDSGQLAPLVRAALRAGDTVMVKGSLGSRMRHVVASLQADDARVGPA
ncbi:UDP-N-acetylmuramoyl-tripeptide--D-alanyl-D-alanine ligase [Gluconacetobacter sp. SXCC-1]|uniref:UDP-N-acetylmuramoyl-tripeptide--D-alanyl-D-alanine ligase n=1 Tax=Komagataeibacter rhaeticus TaxID=215221 RepID=A0A181CBS1_9PROT|nr:UDP-N-acetylmuramoyl-tripeptide--D-alanyl-D-alanine ligase [Komagataeibacter rhaeticus]ATU72338.1 UDP-N-acetylmuramoyl-tripeptide--D-alanyl-D-alanine ligase [Komagataeibacter xylinus]EGG74946.1 UDP-N-acetylmuramoyl-tripeptide--D-alanyl-D-alanine ligase [Gluconacetobacter sp. SXCC-1]QIP35743.1 UDP-N-acetylmuramoyl-tripeptide--D-alanyl-D-alanine ligase [Komagataeibacter rhaeticus]QOC45503.1 UDP-N-acetylmuramoyl-tripeptide--D-alanyl-D-alanine ligase [Komagataeibacter rhaeticus]WPP22070.1 UDP-N